MPYSPSLRTDPFFTLFIKHLPTNDVVSFEGWVTEFSDQYNANWNQESVYGRMDPLPTFENTQRTISLGFDIVSDSINDAAGNLVNINKLIEYQYPLYGEGSRSVQNTLKAAPLLGIRWTNLINNSAQSGYLYGYMNGGLNYSPDMNEGGFIIKGESVFEDLNAGLVPQGQVFGGARSPEGRVTNVNKRPTVNVGDAVSGHTPSDNATIENYRITSKSNSYIPKKVSISFTFNVLHTHLPGWGPNGQKGKVFGGKDNLSYQYPNASMVDVESNIVGRRTASGDLEILAAPDNFVANQALVLEGS